MSSTKVLKKQTLSIDESQRAWLDRLNSLIRQVDEWAKDLGWATRWIEKRMEDCETGNYVAPALLLQEETTRVLLEPIAQSAPGAEGVVDLYLMPAYDDIASLYFSKGAWQVLYMSPSLPSANTNQDAKPKRLTRKIFEMVLTEMRHNAAKAR